jgi:endonuclease/exonuclease/phosphatase family metal-dependent hydrolase
MTQQTLRLASYNIHKAVGLDRRRNPERILQVLTRLDADVVVLQEADLRLGARPTAVPHRLIEAETDFHVLPVAQNDVSLGWHGNAVLVSKSLPVSGFRRIVLPGFEPRGAVRVDVGIGAGFSLVATHLGLMRRDRRAQLHAIMAATEERERVVIAGDFNEWSATQGFEPLQDRFDVIAPGRSFHARRPIAALDRIALSGGMSLRDAGVEQGSLARRASDHLPIWADIDLSGT